MRTIELLGGHGSNIAGVVRRNRHRIAARTAVLIGMQLGNDAPSAEAFDGALAALADVALDGAEDIILLDNGREGHVPLHLPFARSLVAFCRERGFPMSSVAFVAQSPVQPAHRKRLRSLGANGEPAWVPDHHHLRQIAETYAGIDVPDFGFDALRDAPPRLLCLNHKVRPHRIALLCALRARGLDRHVLASFGGRDLPTGFDQAVEEAQRSFPSVPIAPDVVKGFGRTRFDGPFAGITSVDAIPEREARETLLALVTETEAERWMTRITEKTLKPVVHHRPFLVWGSQGSLALLRGFGFRTFAGPIDEGYDLVSNPDDRLRAVVDEVERLVRRLALPQQRADWLEAVRETAAANQRWLREGFLQRLEEDVLAAIGHVLERARGRSLPSVPD